MALNQNAGQAKEKEKRVTSDYVTFTDQTKQKSQTKKTVDFLHPL
jgi:hypothetical protein